MDCQDIEEKLVCSILLGLELHLSHSFIVAFDVITVVAEKVNTPSRKKPKGNSRFSKLSDCMENFKHVRISDISKNTFIMFCLVLQVVLEVIFDFKCKRDPLEGVDVNILDINTQTKLREIRSSTKDGKKL